MALRSTLLFLSCSSVSACSFARSGQPPPDDDIHRHLLKGAKYPVLPGAVATQKNAFFHDDLQLPIKRLSGNDKSLMENLNDYAAKKGEELCHWGFQALPPPRGGPTLLHPFRGYWDVSDGQHDQDIEWVQAYGEVAVSRLHSRIKKGGPVVGAMCSMGAVVAKRRCDNGRSRKEKCIPAIMDEEIQWPMAVSMWKVGHPDLLTALTDWRGNGWNGHRPNIEWDKHTPGAAIARPWNGSMPMRGELRPSGMPTNPADFPVSKGLVWGAPKIAKVVRCSEIPEKFYYNSDDLFYCEHMPNATSSISSVDEAYAVWKSLKGVWPPTKECADDLVSLNQLLGRIAPPLVGSNCSVAYSTLQQFLPNFDCDNSDFNPPMRDVCCSVCGGEPIPDVPKPSPPPQKSQHCSVCNHIYDAEKDGNGKAFEDLPDSWVCPACGAPKAAYQQTSGGQWVHEHEITI